MKSLTYSYLCTLQLTTTPIVYPIWHSNPSGTSVAASKVCQISHRHFRFPSFFSTSPFLPSGTLLSSGNSVLSLSAPFYSTSNAASVPIGSFCPLLSSFDSEASFRPHYRFHSSAIQCDRLLLLDLARFVDFPHQYFCTSVGNCNLGNPHAICACVHNIMFLLMNLPEPFPVI